MATHVTSFAEINSRFDAYIGDIVYATMTTVDKKGRPRARQPEADVPTRRVPGGSQVVLAERTNPRSAA
ncbi:hypothetical protein [Microbispora triticiradicis]|uniref:hypothetical protein n=1 Tax=Microbispora TaxID=2005 RepID=UPI00165237B2|nr:MULTISPECIES: hypothetical protein [Microbispora]